MHNTREIAQDILFVGGSDRRIALFENMFPLENGVTYNAYLILDEKTALIDTVDHSISRQFLENVAHGLAGRSLDYLVINHMEPDHCATIEEIRRLHPGVTIVGNRKTFQLIGQFYNDKLDGATLEAKEGEALSLGKHTLSFIMAPMVHWPEVMFTYEASERILFSADAFGTFGGYTGNLFSDECAYEEMYMAEARRYYTNIVGKFGPQVQAVMKKACTLDFQMIAPLHGPVLRGEAIALITDKYQLWSAYTPEEPGILIAYASMYGNTESAVHMLANQLSLAGVRSMEMYDVSKTHFSWLIASAFRYSHILLASPTYNMGIYGAMEHFMRDMKALNLQNRKVAVIGNGSWAPQAPVLMKELLGEMKNMELLADPMVIKSALKPEQEAEMQALAAVIAASVQNQKTEA